MLRSVDPDNTPRRVSPPWLAPVSGPAVAGPLREDKALCGLFRSGGAVAFDQSQMGQILGSPRDRLVLDHVFHPNEGEIFDHLGCGDEVGEIEGAVRPRSAEGDRSFVGAHNHDIGAFEANKVAEFAGVLPSRSPADHIEIANRIDDSLGEERTASEDRVVPRRQGHGAKKIEQFGAVSGFRQQ